MSNFTDLVFEECRDPHTLIASEFFRSYGLFFFFFSNFVLVASMVWWWRNRSNTRLVIRPKASTFCMVLFSFGDSLASPLHWYFLDGAHPLNSCVFNILSMSLAWDLFMIAVVVKLVIYNNRYRLFQLSKNINQRSSNHQNTLRLAFFSSSETFATRLAIGCGILLFIFTIVQLLFFCPSISKNAVCPNDNPTLLIGSMLLNLFVTAVLLPYTLSNTKKFPDPFGILREALITVLIVVSGKILTQILIETQTVDIVSDVPEDEIIHPFFPTNLANFIAILYAIPYQVYRSKHDKFGLGLLDISLLEVLAEKGSRELFLQHLVQEQNEDNLQFYLRAIRWKQECPQNSGDINITIANNMVNKWIVADSAHEVNISDTKRQEILRTMQKHKLSYPKDLFDSVCAEILSLLENDPFQRFKARGLFKVYLGLALTPEELPVDSFQTSAYL